MDKATENWLKIAKYDLRVAKNSHKSGDYIASVEKTHSSLEKLLKALITAENKTPSKIHDLLRLTSEALVTNLQEEMKDFLMT